LILTYRRSFISVAIVLFSTIDCRAWTFVIARLNVCIEYTTVIIVLLSVTTAFHMATYVVYVMVNLAFALFLPFYVVFFTLLNGFSDLELVSLSIIPSLIKVQRGEYLFITMARHSIEIYEAPMYQTLLPMVLIKSHFIHLTLYFKNPHLIIGLSSTISCIWFILKRCIVFILFAIV